MKKIITIAIDAMGGENAPKKNIEGLDLFLKNNKSNDYSIHLHGDETKINEELRNLKISSDKIKIIHSDSVVSDEESPLAAIKNSKNGMIYQTNTLNN